MVRLFDGEVEVAYFQFYVETPEVIPGEDVGRRFAGQANGLCGAGESGMLQCTTGLHTGRVPVTVERLDAAPDGIDDGAAAGAPDGWEEVVEVSLTTTTPEVLLYDWDHQQPVELPLGRGSFRVRYHACGMEAGRDADVRGPGEPVLDRYLLQFWPADPAPDAVLRQTSDVAGSWHDIARNTPEPTGSAGIDQAGDRDDELAAFHAFIADVTASGPIRQRAAARWLAHHAADTAGPATAAWLRPALDALDHDQPLPPPFDDDERTLSALHRDLAHLDGARHATGHKGGHGDGHDDGPRAPRASMAALATVRFAANPDPWAAVMSALNTANVDRRPDTELHAELRRRFLT